MTIFYADDDSDDRDLFCEAIQHINSQIKIDLAVDGQQALRDLTTRNKLPDFIFLDINMPGMTGIKCLEELKASPKLSHIPVIMYTTAIDKDTRRLCISNGAQDYIIKPNSFAEVISVLQKTFNKDYTHIFQRVDSSIRQSINRQGI